MFLSIRSDWGYVDSRIPERKTGKRKRQARNETRKSLRWKEKRES